jgi:hypothetical protein
MSKPWQINRRHFLRGAGGVMLSLPMLEIMGNEKKSAQPPTRFLTVFQPNGVYPKAWNVEGEGKDYKFSRILQPLESLREDFTLLSNIDNTEAGNHVSMTAAFLTGKNIFNKGSFKSVDQIIADKIGKNTLFPSLVLGTEPPRQGRSNDAPISWANTVCWRAPSQRLSPEINPRVAFDRMFRHVMDPVAAKKRGAIRKSVLDLAKDDLQILQKKASRLDKAKLDEYYTSLRAVEQGIEKSQNPPKRDWVSPMKPEYIRPAAGIPRDRAQHLKLMMDLMVLAFWTDTTRVGTLMAAHGFSRQNFGFLDGVQGDHHGMSHHKEKEKSVEEYTKVSVWYASQVAYLLKRMKEIDDGAGFMLDNSLVLYGSGMKDGNGHIKKNLPLVVAGKAGGKLKPGTHLKTSESTPLPNLLVTVQQTFGIESNTINGVGSGTINGLL